MLIPDALRSEHRITGDPGDIWAAWALLVGFAGALITGSVAEGPLEVPNTPQMHSWLSTAISAPRRAPHTHTAHANTAQVSVSSPLRARVTHQGHLSY